MYMMDINSDIWGFLDHFVFALAFVFLFYSLSLIKKRLIRIPLLLMLTIANIIIFWSNLVYFRFFRGWINIDIFKQLEDLPSVTSAVWTLMMWQDFIFLLLLPLVLLSIATANMNKPMVVKRISMVLVLAVAIFAVHSLNKDDKYNLSSINPMIDLPRQAYSRLSIMLHRSELRKNAAKEVKRLYPLDGLYEYTGDPDFPLVKKPINGKSLGLYDWKEKKPNIVFILLESVRAFESGFYNKRLETYTPSFDALAREGMVFTNFYANGTQTVRGEFASLFSFYPNFEGGPVYVNHSGKSYRSLPAILKEHGYSTLWISSYSADYHNKKDFLFNKGIDDFYDHVPVKHKKRPDIGWGPADEDMFDYALEKMSRQKEPFFAEIMTLSNHFQFDWEYPTINRTPSAKGSKLYKDYTKGIFYTDYSLGEFIKKARKRKFFKNTIFVITGDHGIWLFPSEKGLNKARKEEIYFRMPLVIYSPGLIESEVIETPGSQVDIAPTLLDILGISARNPFVGTSLLRNPSSMRYVLTLHDRKWNLRADNNYCYDLGDEVFYEHFPGIPKTYVKKNRNNPHICFSTEKDLLTQVDAVDTEVLSDNEQEKLVGMAEDIIEINTFLLLSDNIWPSKKRLSVFSKQQYIGHAFGEIGGEIYTNSLEAFKKNYRLGRRIFEVDLSVTADNEVVCFHNGKEKMYGLEKPIGQTTLVEFKKSSISNKYTPLDLNDLIRLMRKHRDMYIVTDTKGSFSYILSKLVEESKRIDPDITKRIIPQIYNEKNYFEAMDIYPFTDIIFTLYRTRASDEQIIGFIADKENITALTVHISRIDDRLLSESVTLGRFIFLHTINDETIMNQYRKYGVHGFYTDSYFTSKEKTKLSKRFGAY
jgi:phosphoglycerol transferase MdoB-like AlkP superfamily enzyme/glycerophosphoryl diester phosphodiesterase